MNDLSLRMTGISKAFDQVQALNNVDFNCRRGEIHALIGENGAGKSTLMNILGGAIRPDAGQILIDEKPVSIQNPRDAYSFGIGFVHQETNLFLNLCVWENIFIAHETLTGRRALNKRAMIEKVRETARELNYELDPDAPLRALSAAQRQLTEITRAMIGNPRILILDEPTAALTEDEVKKLFEILDHLRAQGVTVIYISHRLEEIEAIADRVTVLKDGRLVGTLNRDELDRDAMITMMVGRSLKDIYPPKASSVGEPLLTVQKLSGARFRDVSLCVHAGEILGLGGLDGQGQRDFLRAVYGDIPCGGGSVELRGKRLAGGIRRRIRAKMCYVTYDRRGEGVIPQQSVKNNLTAVALPTRFGFIRRKAERRDAERMVQSFLIKTAGIGQKIETLSGGNQQKAVLSRFVLPAPEVLLVDEPTRGIDVGSRMAIYELLRKLANTGVGVIMLTSDMMELIGLSDRIAVFHGGTVAAVFDAQNATEEKIMAAFSGAEEVDAHAQEA